VVSVCGSCERKNGEMVGEGGRKMITVAAEMIVGSLGYRAVAYSDIPRWNATRFNPCPALTEVAASDRAAFQV
jgi:hypothetical protein